MKDQLLSLIRMRGPVVPRDISRSLKIDTMFAGAHLSELVEQGKLVVSTAKIGGSPVYYLPDQQNKLEILYPHLNDKDQKAYSLLKEKKIVRDSSQIPIIRVALRAIKDFAVPLQIRTDNSTELFWKWHLASNDEAKAIISQILENERSISQPIAEIKKDEIKEVQQEEAKEIVSQQPEIPLLKEEPKLREEKPKIQKPKKELQQTEMLQDYSSTDDEFFKLLTLYFKEKEIEIINFDIKKKNSEIDVIVMVPSVVGKIQYYCKAKKKKKCNDGDLSTAFVQGQLKKLPTLFLSTGEITKKAQSMLDNEFKNHLIFKNIQNGS